MDEKQTIKIKKTTLTIIILSVLLAVSIGFNIYYGSKSGIIKHAEELRATVARMELIIDEFELIHAEQGEQLRDALTELRISSELASELGDSNRRAVELVRRSNARLTQFEGAINSTATTIDGLIVRQRLINEYFREQSEDNRRLREALGISN